MTHAMTVPVDQLPVAAPASESAAILNVIERMATNPDIDPDRIERFIALKERIDASAAKLAFSRAVAEAKARIADQPILKNQKGHNYKRYADFSAYAKVVDPVLSDLGLTYRFRTAQTDRITVTCVITGHGHEEENSLSGPADASGSKNAIQAIGSTLTYLQRYTLVQALGLAASDDDDGIAAGSGTVISDEQRNTILHLIDEVGADVARFCSYFKITAIPALPASQYARAVQSLEAKRAKP